MGLLRLRRDGGFYANVSKWGLKTDLRISQTVAEEKLMDAIQVYLEDLSISKGGINLKVSRSYTFFYIKKSLMTNPSGVGLLWRLKNIQNNRHML